VVDFFDPMEFFAQATSLVLFRLRAWPESSSKLLRIDKPRCSHGSKPL